MRNIKNQKGSVTLFVVITVLFFVIITIAVYVSNSNTRVSQMQEIARIKEVYEADLGKIDQIYEDVANGGMQDGWNKDKVTDIVEEGDKKAPIPKGYVVSKADGEKSISGGLVIYEGTEDVTNNNVAEAQKTRNQYVWIPVDEINDMIMCKSKTAGTQCNIVKEDDVDAPNGFKLKCSTHNSEDLVGKIYDSTKTAGSSGTPYTYTMDFSQTNQSYSPNSGRREPAVVTGNSSGDGDKYDNASDNYHGLGNAQNLLTQMNNDFVEMVKSVYVYGGFYVGRYEVGVEGATKREQTVLNNSYSSANNWYGLYKTIRHKATGDEVVNKDMIWRKPI